MKCRICGTTLPNGAKFCPGCGAEVAADTEPNSKMDNNTVEDAYYREIDDAEYEAIKKREKEQERAREEAERQKAVEEKRAKEEAARWRVEEEKRAREKAERWRAAEKKRAKEEAEKQKEEERLRKEKAWREAERESKDRKIYEGYTTPDRDGKTAKKANKKTENKQKKEKQDKQNENQKKGMSVIAYLIIILVGGFALYRTGIVDNIVSSMNSKQSSVEKQGDSKGSSRGTDKTAETSKKDTEHTEEKESTKHVLADTDNHTMNANACLNTEAYHTVTAGDGSFSFGYPKYLFNSSKVDESGTSYTLSYKGDFGKKEAELEVYTKPNKGDALENAKALYDEYASSVYKIYFKMQPTRIDSKGMARALIGGSVDDSETTGVYIIAVNDGEKNYILKFTYPDPDIQYDYNAIDYVVDCVYRYCSFSGTTYQPRTYEQFKADDMGTKK